MKFSFKKLGFVLVITGILFSGISSNKVSAADNLVINGGFETPSVTNPDNWDIFPSGTANLGWTVEWLPTTPSTYNGYTRPTTATLELQKNGHLGFISAEGEQWAELDTDWFGPNFTPYMSEPSSVKIFQDIATIPGNTYSLTFSFSPRPDASSSYENILNVSWNGQQVDSISKQNNSGTQNEWQQYTYTLNANASTTRLEFADGAIPDSVGTYLDNVMLTETGGNGGGGGGGTSTSTGTSTATTTDPTGGTGGGGSTGTSTATTTPSDSGTDSSSGGGGSISSPVVTASGYGSSGPISSGGGQVLGASTGPGSSTQSPGTVLGDSTSTIPGMPYTGTNGNTMLTYLLGYLSIVLVSEALINYFSQYKKRD